MPLLANSVQHTELEERAVVAAGLVQGQHRGLGLPKTNEGSRHKLTT